MVEAELSTGRDHFSWTRPDPTRRNVDPTRPAINDKKSDPIRPDPPKSGKIVTRPDPRVHPTRGQLWVEVWRGDTMSLPPWVTPTLATLLHMALNLLTYLLTRGRNTRRRNTRRRNTSRRNTIRKTTRRKNAGRQNISRMNKRRMTTLWEVVRIEQRTNSRGSSIRTFDRENCGQLPRLPPCIVYA